MTVAPGSTWPVTKGCSDAEDVGQQRHAAPADPFRLFDLYRDAGQDLLAPGPAAAQPRLLAADVGLVHLHRAGQQVTARPHQHRPQAVQHRPRCLVGADLQSPLQAQRRDPVLGRGEQPARGEPDRQRRPGPVEDRPRRHRGPMPAGGAHDAAVPEPPAFAEAALRAHEPLRPSHPLQVVQTVGIGAEPSLELAHRPAPPGDLGADGPTRSTVAPSRPHHASLAERPIRRLYPR